MARKAKYPVQWLKIKNGEELIGEIIKLDANRIIIRRPCMVVYTGETMILSPYGLYSTNRDFTFSRSDVIINVDVIDSIAKYYEVSLEYASDHGQRFDNIVKRLVNKFEAAILERDKETFGPTISELKSVQKEEEVEYNPDVHNTEEEVPQPSKKELVDRVIALAEKKGLGKKKNEAGNKEEK